MNHASPAGAEVGDFLRDQPLFSSIPPERMARMLRSATVRVLSDEEALVEESEPSSTVAVILSGEVDILRTTGDEEVLLATRAAGEPIGETGVLTGTARSATARARGGATVVEIPGRDFTAAMHATPEALQFLLGKVIDRLQNAEAELVSQQKLAALGVLAAGLAHELNNPASAVERSAHHLREAVSAFERSALRLGQLDLGADALEALTALLGDLADPAVDTQWLDPLERSDREGELQSWLAAHGIPSPWTLAPALTSAGVDTATLERWAATAGTEPLPAVLTWAATTATVHDLLGQLSASSRAISEVVAAVKAYTRLDEAPTQDVDIHEGIDQSLTMLRHKLRDVTVHREYDRTLPLIRAYGSQLNQVWTNLIDNAADAMEGAGELTITTGRRDGCLVVSFADTGPGLPDEVRKHLFEPFYTTKPLGRGTGIGLSITRNIVRRHNGRIHAESRARGTCFVVSLPEGGVTE